MTDTYTTIRGPFRFESKDRGSRFIADAVPVTARAEAEAALEAVRQESYDATHHCYAWRIGTGGEQYRIHDDGEPGGSAGRPILAAIDRSGLTNVLVIVTRYFGGTKLGVGGLVRAYGDAAAGALQGAGILVCYLTAVCTVRFGHALIGPVMRVAARREARIVETSYGDGVTMRLEVRRGELERLAADLVDATHGQAEIGPPPGTG